VDSSLPSVVVEIECPITTLKSKSKTRSLLLNSSISNVTNYVFFSDGMLSIQRVGFAFDEGFVSGNDNILDEGGEFSFTTSSFHSYQENYPVSIHFSLFLIDP
jgi:hypothetical protein